MARMSSFIGAIAIADLVKTTLGPKGMDKILQSVRRGAPVNEGGGGGACGALVFVSLPGRAAHRAPSVRVMDAQQMLRA